MTNERPKTLPNHLTIHRSKTKMVQRPLHHRQTTTRADTKMNCKCQTITTEDGRHKITEALTKHKPVYGITPFALANAIQAPQKQIVRKNKYQRTYSKTRKNKSIHAKLILTKETAITGSCNFTTNSIQNEHEFVEITCKHCHPDKYRKYKEFFETIWNRSQEITQKKVQTT